MADNVPADGAASNTAANGQAASERSAVDRPAGAWLVGIAAMAAVAAAGSVAGAMLSGPSAEQAAYIVWAGVASISILFLVIPAWRADRRARAEKAGSQPAA